MSVLKIFEIRSREVKRDHAYKQKKDVLAEKTREISGLCLDKSSKENND